MDARELHKQFVDYGRRALEWRRRCELLLPQIVELQVWKKQGFSSIYEYAAKLAGMSHSSVDTALWVMRKIENKPELVRVAEEKGLSRVRPVANVASVDDAGFWAEKAMEMPRDALRTYVREIKTQNVKDADRLGFCAGAKKSIVKLELPTDLARRLEALKASPELERVLGEALQQLEKPAVPKPQPVKEAKRYIPARVRHYVTQQTSGRCAFPGCTKPYAILHHTQRFALENTHDPDRLVPLCKPHERLAHLGLIENEQQSPEHWKIRLQPDRSLPAYAIDQQVMLFRGG